MKYALFFSGRITAYEDCLDHLIQFKNNNDVTFFCSLNCAELSEYEHNFFKLLDIKPGQYQYSSTKAPTWIYTLNSYDLFTVPYNAFSQISNNNICMNMIELYMKEKNVSFDCIIKYRADILTNRHLSIQHLLPNTIYIPLGNDHEGINDQIAYGDFNVMKKYASLIDNIQFFCTEKNVAYHPESLLLFNLRYHNINIVRYLFEYDLHSKRKI